MNSEQPKIVFQGGPLDSKTLPDLIQVFTTDNADPSGDKANTARQQHGTYVSVAVTSGQVVYEWKGTTP